MSTLWDPIDSSPPGSLVPGILQARTLEWVAISFSNAWKWKVKVKSLSRVRLFTTPWATAHQAPPSMGFSRQEYWSGVPSPSPSCGDRAVHCSGFSYCWAWTLGNYWSLGASVFAVPGLQGTGSIAVVHRLSCSKACGIFPDQGLNLALLHWQVDSSVLSYQGSPVICF